MKRVAVLMGGLSAEREVSLVSGAACAKALRELGYDVTEIDMQADIAAKLAVAKPDFVFNALHGRFGEDGCVQGLLEILNIPYTHSGVLASSIAMDKPMAKKIFGLAGLRCPAGRVLRLKDVSADPLPRPYVLKPACEGSSVGVRIVAALDNRAYAQIIEGLGEELYLAEAYIPGRELTVAVLDGEALGVTELRVHSGFYDYENKYTDGKTEHLCPAPVPENIAQEAKDMAVRAHQALGCRGLSRCDFRYDENDGLYLLELNTQPGMTPLSLAPEQAKYRGMDFNELVRRIAATTQ